MTDATALALDMGSSSGKAMLGELKDGILHTTMVNRIPHRLRETTEGFFWNLEKITSGMEESIRVATEKLGHTPASVSVDTWGVDYALIGEDGKLVAPPHAYRDPRTEKVRDDFYARLSPADLFYLTGVQPQDINTVLQLQADIKLTPEVAKRVAHALPLPDFFLYFLSGEKGWSKGICSSTAIAEAGTKRWSQKVLKAAGIPAHWLGPISSEMTPVGYHGEAAVVRAGSHDTACAVNSLPVDAKESPLFISCGSWSLAGACTPEPVTSPAALQAGLTNETRADGGNRLLNNMSGMWIFQECMRQWESEGKDISYRTLDDAALLVNDIDFVIDPGHEILMGPKNMPQKIHNLVLEKYGAEAADKVQTPGALTRLINQSLAVAHARTMAAIGEIAGIDSDTIYMVGGGINNRALCQYTADATQKRVVAGPEEASATGNLLAQFQALGTITAADRQEIVRASFSPIEYTPNPDSPLPEWVAHLDN